MVIERWVAKGAKFDGEDPEADWVALINRTRAITIPESYPFPMPITALAFAPSGEQVADLGLSRAEHLRDRRRRARPPLAGPGRADLRPRLQPRRQAPGRRQRRPRAGRLRPALDRGRGRLDRRPGRRWSRATTAVLAVAFSPDGKRLAVGGADRALRVFDVATGERLAEVEDHADWVLDVAYSPDGTRLATASRDKTSKLFDAETFESLVTFPGHGETVYCVDLHRRRQARRQRRRRRPGPDLGPRATTPSRSASSAASAARSSTSSALRRRPASPPAAPTRSSASSTPTTARPSETPRRPRRLGLPPRRLARRQDPGLRLLGRRGPRLGPRGRHPPLARSSPPPATRPSRRGRLNRDNVCRSVLRARRRSDSGQPAEEAAASGSGAPAGARPSAP